MGVLKTKHLVDLIIAYVFGIYSSALALVFESITLLILYDLYALDISSDPTCPTTPPTASKVPSMELKGESNSKESCSAVRRNTVSFLSRILLCNAIQK